MRLTEFLLMPLADQMKAMEKFNSAASRAEELEELLKATRGREHWLSIGGSATDWDAGLSGVVGQFMQFDKDMNPSLDLEAHPALKRHLGQPQEEATPTATTGITRAEDWRQATLAREAKFPRVSA